MSSRPHVVFRGAVAGEEQHLAAGVAQPLRRRLAARFVAVDNGDPGALLGEAFGAGEADAGRAAGNHGDLVADIR